MHFRRGLRINDGLMAQVDSYPLSESVFFKGSLSVGFLALLWSFSPCVIAGLGVFVIAWLFDEPVNQNLTMLFGLATPLCMLIMQPRRSIASQLIARPTAIALNIALRWLGVVFALLMIGFIAQYTPSARRVLLTWAVITPILITIANLGMLKWVRQLSLDLANQRRVVFAGCNESSVFLARRIKNNPSMCMSVAGFFDDRSTERLVPPQDVHLLGNLKALVSYVRSHSVDVIFIALPIRHLPRVLELLDELRDTTASIYYVPDLASFDLIQARTGELLGIPVIAMCETPFYGFRGWSKRLFDIGVCLVALLLLSPLLLLIMALIKLDSPGPAIFKQRRYGLDGAQIMVYKFRTMNVTEDGPQVLQASKDDARVTRIGRLLRRLSLDELPQLFNVLQGRMSLVGPRPHAVAHNEQYRKLIKGYMIRHKVLPGITGLAQVNGCRGETREVADMEARVQYDLEYLRKWSIALDLKILLATVRRLFADDKAY